MGKRFKQIMCFEQIDCLRQKHILFKFIIFISQINRRSDILTLVRQYIPFIYADSLLNVQKMHNEMFE